MKSWNLQDAKARLSELVDRARLGEPQVILRRGEPAAVVIAYAAYTPTEKPPQSVLSFFANSPLRGLDFETPRVPGHMRDLELE